MEGKITGIGGIFFKSDDPEKSKDWYRKNLGLESDQYGHAFQWRKKESPDDFGYTQWSVFKSSTDYFDPSKQDFMVNYRVDNLEALLERLKANGIEQVGEMQSFEYGKFAWILDSDGYKIELWEPIDQVFTDMLEKS